MLGHSIAWDVPRGKEMIIDLLIHTAIDVARQVS